MKVEYTDGCVCYGLDVDGEPFNDLDDAKQREVFNKLIEVIVNEYGFTIANLTQELVYHYGDYKFSHHCDDCGDDVCIYTITI